MKLSEIFEEIRGLEMTFYQVYPARAAAAEKIRNLTVSISRLESLEMQIRQRLYSIQDAASPEVYQLNAKLAQVQAERSNAENLLEAFRNAAQEADGELRSLCSGYESVRYSCVQQLRALSETLTILSDPKSRNLPGLEKCLADTREKKDYYLMFYKGCESRERLIDEVTSGGDAPNPPPELILKKQR